MVLYNSVVSNDSLARNIKNFTDFAHDLKAKKLPQWAFITPNMTNDAHDTTIGFGAAWERTWLEPLLDNEDFMKRTLVLLTYDEDKTYNKTNRIFSVLLGDAVPKSLVGTTDDTFYTHYSTIASVSANWFLPSLGRWDCGANIFQFLANATGYQNYKVDTTNLHVNNTYPGPMSDGSYSKFSPEWPVPLTKGDCSAGYGILRKVVDTWGHLEPTFNYSYPFPWDAKSKYNLNVTATRTVKGKVANLTSEVSAEATKKKGAATAVSVSGSSVITTAALAVILVYFL